jgi:rhodanese-related sulfurtransferase
MAGYLEFVDYGGGVLFAEQIPRIDHSKMMVIDVRDATQFAQQHTPGTVNIERRNVLAQSNRIRKDRTVLIYCNSGSLSAQAEWKAKGRQDANTKAAAVPPRCH